MPKNGSDTLERQCRLRTQYIRSSNTQEWFRYFGEAMPKNGSDTLERQCRLRTQ